MSTKYPAQIDTGITLPLVVDNLTPVQGKVFNDLRNAVIAIESELGVKPSSTYGTVRARLDTLEINSVQLAQDLGGTNVAPLVIGLQGRPISNAAPATNEVLTWSGTQWVPAPSSGGVQLAQDLGGTLSTPLVIGLQGRPVSNMAPATNDVLTWNGTAWGPAAGGGGGGSQTLAQTLALGNVTGGNNILLNETDSISGNGDGIDVHIIGADGVTNDAGNILITGGTNTNSGHAGGSVNLTGGSGDTVGGNIICIGGNSGLGGTGGGFIFEAGASNNGAAGQGCIVEIDGGTGDTGGGLTITGGNAASGNSGNITLIGGSGTGGTGGTGGIISAGGGSDASGGGVSLTGGTTSDTTAGGNINITSGGSAGGNSGDVIINSGNASAIGVSSGDVRISSGLSTNGSTGNININAVGPGGTDATSGNISLSVATSTGSATAGTISISGGPGGTTGNGSAIQITSGNGGGTSGDGGNITISGGNAVSGSGGNITLTPGTGTTAGQVIVSGKLTVTGLIDPTGMVFVQQASVPFTPAVSTKGTLWVKNTSPNTLIFTNGSGIDTTLGGGGSQTLSQTLNNGNSTDGYNIIITSGDSVIGKAGVGGAGAYVPIVGGQGGTTFAGGYVTITGGAGGATSGDAGGITISGGTPTAGNGGPISISASNGVGTDKNGGALSLTAGNATGAGAGGAISLTAGNGVSAGAAGNVTINAGNGGTTSNAGTVTITSGNGGGTSGDSGAINLTVGTVTSGNGGSITLTAGDANDISSALNGGNVVLHPGAKYGAGSNGVVQITGSGAAIRFDQVSAVPTSPGSNKGTVWTKNTAPTSFVFTDSSGVDCIMGNTTPSTFSGSSNTFALTDRYKYIAVDNATATTVTVPTNASVAFPVGTMLNFYQNNTGQVTVAAAGGVTINTPETLLLRKQYSSATLTKVATDTWILTGDLQLA